MTSIDGNTFKDVSKIDQLGCDCNMTSLLFVCTEVTKFKQKYVAGKGRVVLAQLGL